MIPPVYTKWKSWILPLLALGLGSALARIYFTVPETAERVRDQWSMFYPNLDPGWLRLTESELNHALTSGELDDWEQMVTRTALGRWRLRTLDPRPFDNVMNDYQRGLWSAPDRAVWERQFASLDAQWIGRREAELARQAAPPASEVTTHGDMLHVDFPLKPSTAQIGSYIRLLFDSAPGDVPRKGLICYWETDPMSGRSGARARGARCTILEDQPPAGRVRFALDLDMSWEPGWLAPTATNPRLRYRAPEANRWEFIAAEFGDSPYLPLSAGPPETAHP